MNATVSKILRGGIWGVVLGVAVSGALMYFHVMEPWLRRKDVAHRSTEKSALGPDLADAAHLQIGITTGYDPSYVEINYPYGDVPVHTGVCSDVVVRAVRIALRSDLQRLVHEDMAGNFARYPPIWHLREPDANIDHRRVANLMCFFERKGHSLAVTREDGDYQTGDIVAWWLFYKRYHIGIVSDEVVPGTNRHLIIHNIGGGVVKEDLLRKYPVIGHYRL